MLIKIFIIVTLTGLFLFFGQQYSQESTRKHEEFLLTQSLFPEISEFVYKNKIHLQPIKIKLNKKSFIIYIHSQNQNDEITIQAFISDWLRSNLKFHDYQFHVEILNSEKSEN